MSIEHNNKQFTTEFLTDARFRTDPLADEAAEAIIHSADVHHLQSVIRTMATMDQGIPEGLPKEVHDFFEKSAALNLTEEDKARLDRASDTFSTYGPMIVMSLIFRALPVTYMAQKPAHVLDLTKMLEAFTERRIIETAQFVFDSMEHGWYNPDKRGIRTIQRVRLMHAGIRHLIRHKIKEDQEGMAYEWEQDWGEPISQEDLLATLQTFSLEVLKGLERLGIKLSEKEMDDWFFAWQKVGTVLGVEERMMPNCREHADELQTKIYKQLFILPNKPGERLTASLVKTIQNLAPPGIVRDHTLVLMRYMINNDYWYYRHMGLPNQGKHWPFIIFMKISIGFYGLLARLKGGPNSFVSKMAMKLLKGVYNQKRAGKDIGFIIPHNLVELWDMEQKIVDSTHQPA
jgi:hypothetical protein